MAEPTCPDGTYREMSFTVETLGMTTTLDDLPFIAANLRARVIRNELGRSVLWIRSRVLSQRIPPQTIHQPASGWTDQQRFATWWDHFKATYRQRWWMRWRRWAVHYTTDRIPFEGRTTIQIHGKWLMPYAPALPIPSEFEFGEAVLHADVAEVRYESW